MTEDRGQKTEDRGQKTDDRRQRTEDRRQRTEDRAKTVVKNVKDLKVYQMAYKLTVTVIWTV